MFFIPYEFMTQCLIDLQYILSILRDHRYPGIDKLSVCLLHAWLANMNLQSRLRETESENLRNLCNRTQGLVREIENFRDQE